MMNHAKQLPYIFNRPRQYLVESIDVARLQSSNDSHQRVFHQEHLGRKLLAIASMLLVMVFLVWSMG